MAYAQQCIDSSNQKENGGGCPCSHEVHIWVTQSNSNVVHAMYLDCRGYTRHQKCGFAKEMGVLNSFLVARWETKVVIHQGDKIKCSVIGELLVFRYHIAKQSLSMVFSYRRWKQTRGVWEALDSDVNVQEAIEL